MRDKVQIFAIADAYVEAACLRGLDQFRAVVDARQPRARRGDLFGQVSVTATDIENTFARKRIQQVDRSAGKIADKASVVFIELRAPLLAL
ncbi:hypothetical protein WK15_09780 [Burkholderia ubonensis]|nr:hypothetical protein [Burkholderia ubonensis]KVR28979.1 hypothetical protein WK15_09780 [Burkholderia ubonensis]KWB97603.1 hypothetical protein WL45_08935 [Burkholderia ubonensis]